MAVRIEKKGRVWTVIHSRPEARNAMDPESARCARCGVRRPSSSDPEAAVAVLWGEGGAFCAGWDLKYGASLIGSADCTRSTTLEDRKSIPRGPLGPTRLELDKPVIAAVAGPAVAGGFELALWCDVRVMEESAYFGVYCRRWGVPLIDGGTVRLPRIVGMGRALEIILTGRKVPAEEALRIGACEHVVPDGSRASSPRRWRTRSRAFRRPACAPTGARPTRSKGSARARRCARSGTTASRRSSPKARRAPARFASGKGRHGDFGDI